MIIAVMRKEESMAEIKIPIQVNLPDDWIEQIIDRLRNDPEAEWVEIVRCKDCKHWDGEKRGQFYYFERCSLHRCSALSNNFCSWAERREE